MKKALSTCCVNEWEFMSVCWWSLPCLSFWVELWMSNCWQVSGIWVKEHKWLHILRHRWLEMAMHLDGKISFKYKRSQRALSFQTSWSSGATCSVEGIVVGNYHTNLLVCLFGERDLITLSKIFLIINTCWLIDLRLFRMSVLRLFRVILFCCSNPYNFCEH